MVANHFKITMMMMMKRMRRRRAGNWEMNEWRSHETGSAEHGDDCPLLVLSCDLQLSTSGDILVLVLSFNI